MSQRLRKLSKFLLRSGYEKEYQMIRHLIKISENENDESVELKKDMVFAEDWDSYVEMTEPTSANGVMYTGEDVKSAFEDWAKKFNHSKSYKSFKDHYFERKSKISSSILNEDGELHPSDLVKILEEEIDSGESFFRNSRGGDPTRDYDAEPPDIQQHRDSSELEEIKAMSGSIITPKFSFEVVPCVNCSNLALQESENWENGTFSEEDERAIPLMKQYWDYTSKYNSTERNRDRWYDYKWIKNRDPDNPRGFYHWSAAYVSWVMGQHDGEGAKWFVYESHSGYRRHVTKTRREIEENPKEFIGELVYIPFTKSELSRYGLDYDEGDVVGRSSHMDIYVGNGELIGGNTSSSNEHVEEVHGKRKFYENGTSGRKPLREGIVDMIIKRVRILGPGEENSDKDVS